MHHATYSGQNPLNSCGLSKSNAILNPCKDDNTQELFDVGTAVANPYVCLRRESVPFDFISLSSGAVSSGREQAAPSLSNSELSFSWPAQEPKV